MDPASLACPRSAELLTPAEAARLAGTGVRRVREWCRRGLLTLHPAEDGTRLLRAEVETVRERAQRLGGEQRRETQRLRGIRPPAAWSGPLREALERATPNNAAGFRWAWGRARRRDGRVTLLLACREPDGTVTLSVTLPPHGGAREWRARPDEPGGGQVEIDAAHPFLRRARWVPEVS